jgi:hypothetical protein
MKFNPDVPHSEEPYQQNTLATLSANKILPETNHEKYQSPVKYL